VLGALVGFGHALAGLGVEGGVARLETAARAVGTVDPRDREAVYWALRCSLLSRIEEAEAFDAAFDAFWQGAPLHLVRQSASIVPPPEAELDEQRPAVPQVGLERRGTPGSSPGRAEGPGAGSGWSAVERLRVMDFADYGPEDLAAAARLVRRIALGLPRRRSRRLRPAERGTYLDRRATLRAAMRSDGHPLELAWRRRLSVPRRLIFLVDVSGSMEPYARVVLLFLQAARQASPGVEAFAFGTRLTRITHELRGRDSDAAVSRAAEAVADWSGGTRIGDALATLNREYARNVGRGSVVVVLSDGWDRGDPGELAAEMARLRRCAHRVVWLNPLAADPRYEPLTRGMQAALPHVDHLLPGHSIASLETLASLMEEELG
jgi:uncharacterized protein